MIIWGGYGGTSLNSGGRYYPETDNWLPVSNGVNLPSARYGHTAVWTGNEMLVWGGVAFNTGGRYNPNADSWLPTSIGANVPAARYDHTAVWTGTEMIIWGGSDGGGTVMNSGGRYYPGSNNWLPISTGVGLPSGRFGHTAVWTGVEMIVWGGRVSSGFFTNTGGRYHPSSDRWLSTAIDGNTPGNRYFHAAVWDGNSMIIWGGGVMGDAVNDGGIYTSGSAASPGNSLRGGKSSSINLNWANIYGTGSYNVKRCNPTAISCVPGAIVSTPTINQYSEPDDGISHFYTVEAVNQCGATP